MYNLKNVIVIHRKIDLSFYLFQFIAFILNIGWIIVYMSVFAVLSEQNIWMFSIFSKCMNIYFTIKY